MLSEGIPAQALTVLKKEKVPELRHNYQEQLPIFSLNKLDAQMVLTGSCSQLTLETEMEHKGKGSPGHLGFVGHLELHPEDY